MTSRNTRILKHPDGTFTVEFQVKATLPPDKPMGIPRTVTEWVRDPGHAVQLAFGLIGQHRTLEAATARALALKVCDENGIYAEVVETFLTDEAKGVQ